MLVYYTAGKSGFAIEFYPLFLLLRQIKAVATDTPVDLEISKFIHTPL